MSNPFLTRRCLLPLLALLVSCGGGGGGGPSVSSLGAANARYGLTTTITVNGRNLREGIELAVEGPCENLRKVASTSDDSQPYTCDVRGTGRLRFFVVDSTGAFIAQLDVDVPLPQVSFTTASGSFTVELDPAAAPATSLNFVQVVADGFYTSTLVHRVLAGKGIIAGGYTTGPRVKNPTRGAFALESSNGLKNLRGTLGMFRTGGADSARTQFHVNTADNPDLDYVDEANPGFAVFGRVIAGLEVVDAMTQVATRVDIPTLLTDVPATEIVITAVSRVK
jgi:cyclophilin family peptidyl-prolyl cis-trans isomerase